MRIMHPASARPYTLLAILAAGALLLSLSPAPFSAAGTAPGETYTSYAYSFSFEVPAGFSVRNIPNQDTETYVIEDEAGIRGVQLLIYFFDEEPSALTPERIEEDTGLRLSDITPIEQPGFGFAFATDNDQWGGASSDVWFVYKGSLYELTAHPADAALLRAIVASWQFF